MSEPFELIIAFFVGGLVGLFFGIGATSTFYKNDAVNKGKAEYYLDESHEKQWRWK